jgi:hypothetical protein
MTQDCAIARLQDDEWFCGNDKPTPQITLFFSHLASLARSFNPLNKLFIECNAYFDEGAKEQENDDALDTISRTVRPE